MCSLIAVLGGWCSSFRRGPALGMDRPPLLDDLRDRQKSLGRLLRLLMLAVAIALSHAPATQAVIVNHFEYGVLLQAQDFGTLEGDGVTEGPPALESAAPIDELKGGGAEAGVASADCTISASARPGHLALAVSGNVAAGSNAVGFGLSSCRAMVQTSELVVLDTPSIPPNVTVRIHALHFLIGTSVSVTTNSQFPDQSNATAALSLPGNTYQVNRLGGTIVPPLTFNTTLEVQVGQVKLLSMRLEGSGLATASDGHADYSARAGNSLHWGGVNWVEDVETGEPITDWTITSESGTDYSQPVDLPEPSSTVLVATGVLALASVASMRRSRRSCCLPLPV